MQANEFSNYRSKGFTTKIPQNFYYTFSNCLFNSFAKATPISADSVGSTLEMKKCIFNIIRGSENGGCIHVNCPNHNFNIRLNKIIAEKCDSENKEGSFAYFMTKSDITISNCIISQCSPEESSKHYTFTAIGTNTNHTGGNFTFCKAYSDLFYSKSAKSTLYWCQFKQNVLSKHGVVVCDGGSHIVKYAYFGENIDKSANGVGATLYGFYAESLLVSNSYFFKNENKYLISSLDSRVTIVDCVIDIYNFQGIYSSSGLTSKGTVPQTSVVYPIQLNDECARSISLDKRLKQVFCCCFFLYE